MRPPDYSYAPKIGEIKKGLKSPLTLRIEVLFKTPAVFLKAPCTGLGAMVQLTRLIRSD